MLEAIQHIARQPAGGLRVQMCYHVYFYPAFASQLCHFLGEKDVVLAALLSGAVSPCGGWAIMDGGKVEGTIRCCSWMKLSNRALA